MQRLFARKCVTFVRHVFLLLFRVYISTSRCDKSDVLRVRYIYTRCCFGAGVKRREKSRVCVCGSTWGRIERARKSVRGCSSRVRCCDICVSHLGRMRSSDDLRRDRRDDDVEFVFMMGRKRAKFPPENARERALQFVFGWEPPLECC